MSTDGPSSYLPDPEAGTAFGRALAKLLRPGDCVLLEGPLGAGKSHVARAVIQSLQAPFGAVDDVPSPTYTLVQSYAAGATEIVHADLYRLSGPDEVAELGLTDAFDNAITLIEWPDRLGELTPEDALHVALSPESGGRRVRVRGRGWDARLDPFAILADG